MPSHYNFEITKKLHPNRNQYFPSHIKDVSDYSTIKYQIFWHHYSTHIQVLWWHLHYIFTAPSGFEVVECSDCSITIAWDENVQDNCFGYELRHRVPGPDNWEVTKFSTTDVSSDESGRCMYTLLNISPDTGYEIKLCSVDTNGNSQFTESKTKQTLKRGNETFDLLFLLNDRLTSCFKMIVHNYFSESSTLWFYWGSARV